MDQQLVETLCRLHPRRWAEAVIRHEAVDAYLALPDESVQTVRDCASRIGVDERTFYRMVAMRRVTPSGRGRPPLREKVPAHIARSHPALNPDLEEIITLALDRVALPCQLSLVQAEVLRLSQERKVSPPARCTVRSRFRDTRHGATSGGADSSWILDSCTLAVDLAGPEGAIAPAVLVALVQPSTRQVFLHGLFCGQPSQMEIMKLFIDLGAAAGRPKIPASIFASSAFRLHADVLGSLLQPRGTTVTAPALSSRGAANPMIAGEAIRAVLGSQLGKIAIRTRRARGNRSDVVVPLATARTVVANLIGRLTPYQA